MTVNLDKATALLSPEIMALVRRAPYNLQGWKILERWTSQEPEALKGLESRGLLSFINVLLNQQAAESNALNSRLSDTHLSDMEKLQMAAVDTTLASRMAA